MIIINNNIMINNGIIILALWLFINNNGGCTTMCTTRILWTKMYTPGLGVGPATSCSIIHRISYCCAGLNYISCAGGYTPIIVHVALAARATAPVG